VWLLHNGLEKSFDLINYNGAYDELSTASIAREIEKRRIILFLAKQNQNIEQISENKNNVVRLSLVD
jgi:hypothetical protein